MEYSRIRDTCRNCAVWTSQLEPQLEHQIIQHNQRAGVIVSSGDLAIQGVTRHQAGNYTCTASNVEGDGDSNVVELKVMCKYTNSE
uniref:Ig-like domain-containing protein n=1 Tax=Glossina austeni TaxID=7395 RepID=A0A1A9USK1_GLOAU